MDTQAANSTYSPAEELINVYSHAVGAVLSIIALALLILRSIQETGILPLVSFTIFGASLVMLYITSTVYHNCKTPQLRSRLRIFDHVSIYVLIAGTYTPFALITLQGMTGWLIFGISWGFAVTGSSLKLFFTGRFKLISTLMYIFMGWLILFVIKPLANNLVDAGMLWLVIGGISYSLGAIIYSIKRIPFNHAIFHMFVLLGSFCHFVAVYFYLLPQTG
ncbi:MAG: hemolysin III family protein [Gammaproteobacteria bacterium]|jgi:hemolysin III|nr:hemolysin III family protein [Gammaproteobacteria bacterium]